MGVNRSGPPCPECGCLITKVQSTDRGNDLSFWRSRKCITCGHVFRTVQKGELYEIKGTVTWQGRGHHVPTINWSAYET